MQYFTIQDKRNYYVGKWLQKPKNKRVILDGIRVVKRRGVIITIGVADGIVNEIIRLFNEKHKYSFVKGDEDSCIVCVSAKLQLTSGLIKEVLRNKKLIK